MTQNEKDILSKDLCARLPYGVICADIHADEKFTNKWDIFAIDRTFGNEFLQVCISNCGETYGYKIPIERIKPYLFPLSSMTDEQKEFIKNKFCYDWDIDDHPYSLWAHCIDIGDVDELIDWFHKNHFDWRGLIPMGLAENATNKNIY